MLVEPGPERPLVCDWMMDKEANGPLFDSAEAGKPEDSVDGEDFNESKSLLRPRRGGMARKSEKTRRKVQWKDSNGNKLVEILEFEPSDGSDSDEEDNDSCICTIL